MASMNSIVFSHSSKSESTVQVLTNKSSWSCCHTFWSFQRDNENTYFTSVATKVVYTRACYFKGPALMRHRSTEFLWDVSSKSFDVFLGVTKGSDSEKKTFVCKRLFKIFHACVLSQALALMSHRSAELLSDVSQRLAVATTASQESFDSFLEVVEGSGLTQSAAGGASTLSNLWVSMTQSAVRCVFVFCPCVFSWISYFFPATFRNGNDQTCVCSFACCFYRAQLGLFEFSIMR